MEVPPQDAKPTSLRAYAERRGVALSAVQKAIADGRLERSVVIVKGKPKIADPDLADREWAERTRPRIDHLPPPPPSWSATPAPGAPAADGDDPPKDPDYELSYEEARRRREVELWRQARVKREVDELDLAVRRGELVTSREAAEAFAEIIASAKTKLLGLPARIKQRAPHIATADIELVDDLMREALEGLADAAGEADATEPDDDA